MESYNDGRIKNIKEIDNIKQALQDFSEGSEALYDLLKFCYENNIETKACCKGHEKTTARAYIMFSETAMEYMSNLEEMLYYIDAEMTYQPHGNDFNAHCSIHCKKMIKKVPITFLKM